ncbi:mucin-binding protein [Limosilactobacillus albertensis]|uniref:YSIRK-type signal peptide-containing protein n=1 Tax=Limosilactobacillus albertensis TaxID=2759752 RepID=A0A839H9S9_9LACO|nr:YSIRK-type signal peptide-containing protein [Limosilactobacillus albertensis]MBB1122442.1 YSIRK-type signal peptide-containing protein [Limosilactobacillus albertensis]MCD7121072.1 YSIRK-type signal peptide-containing protein [Limosilactobacillus albertensis]
MVSKDNRSLHDDMYTSKKQRFTIKKLTVGVTSVLLGVAFAGTTASANTDNAASTTDNNDESAEQTDHNLVLNSANSETLKTATSANTNAQAAVVNPAGDVKTDVADQYQQAVNQSTSKAIQQSEAATFDVKAAAGQDQSQALNANNVNYSNVANSLQTMAAQAQSENSANVQNTGNDANNAGANAASLYGTSLFSLSDLLGNNTNTDQGTVQGNTETVTDWNQFKSALQDSSITQINIDGQIDVGDTLGAPRFPNNYTGNLTKNWNSSQSNRWRLSDVNANAESIAWSENNSDPIATNGHTVTIKGGTLNLDKYRSAIKLGGNSSWNITFDGTQINGADSQIGALDLWQTGNKNTVTFNNVKATGSALYNGGGDTDVYINGNVSSDVSTTTPALAAQQGLYDNGGDTHGYGDQYTKNASYQDAVTNAVTTANNAAINVNLRATANINASNLTINKGATLTITRSVDGDGIVLADGLIRTSSNDAGTVTNNGHLLVGDNATLNINLNHGDYTAEQIKAGESKAGIAIHNTGIRVNNNGTVASGKNASITIKAGFGRDISLGAYHVNNDAYSNANYVGRGDVGHQSFESSHPQIQNTVSFGDGTIVNMSGRDGFVLGVRSTFHSGQYSTITVANYGNGNGMDLADYSKMYVDEGATLNMLSDGKNNSGYYSENNYFALGEDGKIYVQNGATLKVRLINRSNHNYNDNIQINSVESTSNPYIYVGDGSTLDVQSDAYQGDEELISIPHPSSQSIKFDFGKVKYVNLEKDVYNSGFTGGGGMAGNGNLLFFDGGSAEASLVSKARGGDKAAMQELNDNYRLAGNGNYVVFKWNDATGNGAKPVANVSAVGKQATDRNGQLLSAVQYDPNKTVDENIAAFTKSANQTWSNVQSFSVPLYQYGGAGSYAQAMVTFKDGATSNKSNNGADFADMKNGFYSTYSQRLVIMSQDAAIRPINPDHPLPDSNYTKETLTQNITRDVIYQYKDAAGQEQPISANDLTMPDGSTVINKQSTQYIGTGFVDVATGELVEVETNGQGMPVDANGNLVTVDKNNNPVIAELQNNKLVPKLINGKTVATSYIAKTNADGSLVKGSLTWVPATKENAKFAGFKTPTAKIGTDEYTTSTSEVAGADVLKQNVVTVSDKGIYTNVQKNGKNVTVSDYLNDINSIAKDKGTVTAEPVYVDYVKQDKQAATLKFVDDDNPSNNLHDDLTADGKADTAISFSDTKNTAKDAQSIINDITGQNYVFSGVTGTGVTGQGNSFSNFTLPNYDNDTATNQTFTVHFRHATKHIDHNNPEPDNGYKATDLQKTVTRTINYTGDGISMPSVTQKVTFDGEGTIDEVTGKLVNLDSNGDIVKDSQGYPTTGQLTWTYSYDNNGVTTTGDGNQVTLGAVNTNVPVNYHVASVTPEAQSDGHGNVIADSVKAGDSDIEVVVNLVKDAEQAAQLTFVDDTTGNEIHTGITASGDAGTEISFNNANNVVNDLTKQGYVLTTVTGDNDDVLSNTNYDAANFGNFDNDGDTTQKFVVHFQHGVTAKNYTGLAVRHIVYKVNSNNAANYNPADLAMMSTVDPSITNKDQTVNFTATGDIDAVTGDLVSTKTVNGKTVAGAKMNEADLDWQADGNFAAVDSPSVTNYTVNRSSVASANAQYGAEPVTEYVVYSPVPVQDQTVTIHYIDDSTVGKQNLSGYDATITGKPGTQLNYSTTITKQALEGQHYKIVSDSFADANLKGLMPTNGGNYEVHVVHATRPVTPDNPGNKDGLRNTDLQKDVTRTVNYVDANGAPVAPVVNQTAHFTANGTIDEVTGNLVSVDKNGNITGAGQLTWSGDQSLGKVPAQSVRNMHVDHVDADTTDSVAKDGAVSAKTVNHDSANSVITIHYAADGTHKVNKDAIPTSMTVHFVDDQGKTVHADNVQNNFTFTYDGDTVYDKSGDTVTHGTGWNDQLHSYNSVNVPVVDGYVAEVKSVAGLDVTQKNPNREVTVTYHKIGNIVPQDKNGNPITNPTTGKPEPNKPYVNDPTDPTKVTPGESVPSIPGYRPSVNTVTPTDPTQDTPVVYDNTQNAIVNYVDADEGNRQVATSGVLSGASDSKINYSTAETLASLGKQGYVLETNGFDPVGTAPNYDEDFNATQIYTVTLKHGSKTVTPKDPDPQHGFKTEDLTRTGTQTVHYVGAGENTPKDNTQHVTFNHTLTIDSVTGRVLHDDGWKIAGNNYSSVPTPSVSGYKASEVTAGGSPVSVDPQTGAGNINTYYTVTYSPVAPDVDQQAVVTYIDDTTGTTLSAQNLSGKAGTTSDYRTQPTIDNYVNKGYVLVTGSDTYPADGVTFDNDNNTTQSFEVHFVHGTTDVNKDHPRTGINTDDYTRKVTSTVNYQGAGKKTPAKNTQNAEWNRTLTVDTVTNQVKSATPWEADKANYSEINTPVVDGYTADKANVPAKTVTMDNLTETVNYRPNGHVIPVDQSGKPIPGATQPQYGNDPTDPTKITPNTTAPTIPGYRVVPDQPTINPDGSVKNPTANPTGDTTVVYTNTQTAVVNYIDQDNNNAVITTSGNLTGASGSQINYSSADELNQLASQGYELVEGGNKFDPNGTAPNFDDNFDQSQVFTITLQHKHETVNPNNPDPKHNYTKDSLQKTGTQTVIYQSADKDFTAPATQTQNLTFSHELVIDQVNGTIIEDHGWSPDQTYNTVKSPAVEGYTADKAQVGGDTIKASDSNLNRTYIVNYTKNVTPEVKEQQAVVNYIDATEGKVLQTKNLSGKAGSTDSYRAQPTIDSYTNQGYVLVSNNYPTGGVTYTDNYGTPQTFNIVLRHGTQTITPTDPTPVDPGTPINPNDPDGPKYPTDVQRSNLVKDATQTITYQYSDGSKPATTHVDTAKDAFTRTVTVDKVTGKVTETTPWTGSHSFNNANTPVVNGYHADKAVAGGKTATVGNENVADTVTYSPNGHIIPVDHDGNKIPNAPTPQYPTNPNDPTGVEPKEEVPTIPGYHPVTPTVTPSNPGTDTPVEYVHDQGTITVQYVDQSNNDAILHTDSVKGNYNDKITYSTAAAIKGYTDRGYELVADGFNQGGQVFSDVNNNQVYQVVLRHATTPVGPQTPHTPSQPINPNDPTGPKYPDSVSPANLTKRLTRTINYVDAATGKTVAQPKQQQVTFTASGVLDNVTGQYVTVDANGNIIGNGELTWTGNGDLNAVKSPEVDGMRVSYVSRDDAGNGNVGATTLTHNDTSYDVTVNYVQSGTTTVNGQTKVMTQTVKIIDGDNPGHELRSPIVENFTATRTPDTVDLATGKTTKAGSWDHESHQFGTVDAPQIPGYVAEKVSAGGKTASIDNPNVEDEIVYHKVGNIVPVGPDGKTPLPNVPSQPYTNDPTDPTKVNPHEPVPTVPGYIPTQPTVDPTDPTKDTPVVYTQVEKATLTIVDRDNNKQQIVVPGITTSFTTSGEQGKTISFDGTDTAIAGLEAQGYKFVSSDFHNGDVFDQDAKKDQHFTIVMGHDTTPIDPDHPGAGYSKTDLQKTVTRTINYLDSQGNPMPGHPAVTDSFTFTASGNVDKVTGQLVNVDKNGNIIGAGQLQWNADGHDFAAVPAQAVTGYSIVNVTPGNYANADHKGAINATHITNDSNDIVINVYYAPNGTKTEEGQTITHKQVVHFVDENGNELPGYKANTQTSTFTQTPKVTDPDGTVHNSTWGDDSFQYQTVNVPVVPGYVVTKTTTPINNGTVGGSTVSHADGDVDITVTYSKVGKIIPVDQHGNPIPNAPTPSYPNDPSDPAKVTSNEPIPTVPNYTPVTPTQTVTPSDPTKDTKVVYTNVQNATVNYIDLDGNNAVIATSGNLTGDANTTINYSSTDEIAALKNKGYVLVDNGYDKNGAPKFDNNFNSNQTFTISFRHATTPVDPEHPGAGYNKTDLQKDVTRTVEFVNADTNEPLAGQPSRSQTVHFTASGNVDKVTGQLVSVDKNGQITGAGHLTWSADRSVDGIKTPSVSDMHIGYISRDADGNNVAKTTLSHTSSDYTVIVAYVGDDYTIGTPTNSDVTQTVHFVDEDGNIIRQAIGQTLHFTKSGDKTNEQTHKVTPGQWNINSQHFETVDVPVIPGYVVTKISTPVANGAVGGSTVSPTDSNVDITITYSKVGQIIPVDPTGNPIPNAPTPSYPNDPSDPTKVTPNESVPTISGYTPDVSTVTPEDPTKSTNVVYRQTLQATVAYIDDVTGETLKTDTLNGLEGKASDYTTAQSINDYEAKGYTVAGNDFPADGYTFVKGGQNHFTVHLTHKTTPVDPQRPGAGYNKTDLQKTVTRTINFINAQTGTPVHNPVTQTVTFTGTGTVDEVTGKLVTVENGKITGAGHITWSADQGVDGITPDPVDGMHVGFISADGNGTKSVKAVTLGHDANSYTVTVGYVANGQTIGKVTNVPASQTITFVDEQGHKLRDDNVQSMTFTKPGDITNDQTHEVIPGQWNEESHTFTVVDAPVIPGYIATKASAGGETVTPDSPTANDEIIYHKVSQIIPVDPTGNPIPNAPTPSYPNDPSDPTKVTPNESVPTISGYTPDVSTVTPEDPTKPTNVVYRQNLQATVAYIDDVTGETLKTDTLNGLEGKASGYTTTQSISDYESKGYTVAGNDFPADGYTFVKGGQNHFTVHLTHNTTSVDPQHPGAGYSKTDLQKTVTRTINFINAQTGTPVHNPVTQTVTFTGTGTVDEVTGQLVTVDQNGTITPGGQITWTSAQHVDGLTPEPVSGMHIGYISRDADGTKVAGVQLDHNATDYDVTVVYVLDGTKSADNGQNIPASQVVHFVDENGNALREANTQNSQFIKAPDTIDTTTNTVINHGSWNEESHAFTVVDAPVIPGYVATKASAGGMTVTPDKPTANDEIVYRKVGRIIPVDPTGNPIPNAPTPSYSNDPHNPKAVVPNEPVPAIPGYTPQVPTVTPTTPTDDTKVVYVPVTPTPTVEEQHAVVNYIDSDNGGSLVASSGTLTGKAGSKIDYSTAETLTDLENQGYELVHDGFTAGATYDSDNNTTQTYTVVLKHGHQPINPTQPGKPGEPVNPSDPTGPKYPSDSGVVTTDVMRTIAYVDSNGNALHNPIEQTVHFTAEGEIDKVTGQWITPLTWSSSQTVNGQETPVIAGYHVTSVSRDGDGNNVKSVTLTHGDSNYTVTVTYAANGKIIPVDPTGNPIPNAPTPQYPTDPNDPSKVTPNESVPTIPGYTPSTPTVTPTDPSVDTPVTYTPTTPVTPVTPTEENQNAVVQYIDQDNGNSVIEQSANLTGKAGSQINYSTAATIQALENRGYELVSDGFPTGAVFDNDAKTSQIFKVVLKHGHQTITPNDPTPVTPGEPVNPTDPTGPKYPSDVDHSNLVMDGNQTITYHYSDGRPSTTHVDTVKGAFTRTVTVDKVTGKVTSISSWTGSHEFGKVDTPIVDGYHADKSTAGGKTATPDTPSVTDDVTYTPNGRIVPTDPAGKPITNVPTPQYPTDPSDPTKVMPNEPVPTIPGYTPSTPTVTPTDPSVDTPVTYTPDKVTPAPANNQEMVVTYIDDVTGQTLHRDQLTGKAGTISEYRTTGQIEELTNKGYKLVSNDYPASGAQFDDDDSTTQNYTVHFEHGTTTFNPQHPGTSGDPLNPNDPTGPKVTAGDVDYSMNVTKTVHYIGAGDQTPADNVQNATWTRSITVDNVTGNIISSTNWTSDKESYKSVQTPIVDGYHANKDQVDGSKVTMVSQTVEVQYTANGHIVPVDPSGKPIPGADHPQYPTDPSDPTGITPDEAVPTVPGYTPSTSTVTPEDPGTDTPVTYNPVVTEGTFTVNYVDTNTGRTVHSDKVTGDYGNKITYTTQNEIDKLVHGGYVLVTDEFTNNAGNKFNESNDGHTYTITLKHGTVINPHGNSDVVSQKQTTLTVHYIGAGNHNPADNVQTINWSRYVTVDGVTGDIVSESPWTPSHSNYDAVQTPVIDGYHADTAEVPSQKASEDNVEVTVTYAPNGHIIPVDQNGTAIPGVDHPQYPTDPNDPTKVMPNETVPTVPGYVTTETAITPTDPSVDTPVVYESETPASEASSETPTATPETPVASNGSEAETAESTSAQSATTSTASQATSQASQSQAVNSVAPEQTAQPAEKQEAKRLPQTGNESGKTAAELGALGLSAGLMGLAAGKKKRKEDKEKRD